MKKFLFTVLILCIISPGFAGDVTFTNKDLMIYSDEYLMNKEPAIPYEDKRDNAYNNKNGDGIEQGNDRSKDQREGQRRNLTGESCDVLDFSSHKINYAVHNPDYRISGTITKQTVTVHIKSKWDMPLWIDNFYISVFLEDGTKQTGQLEPAPGDSQTSWIQPDTEYVGYVTLNGNLPIVSVGCQVIK